MSDHHFWLRDAQFARLGPFLPNKPHGVPRVDDHRVISAIGVFDRIFAMLATESAATDAVLIDATHLEAHRTAAGLAKNGGVPRRIGRTKGRLNSKQHAACDGEGEGEGEGKSLILLLTEGQVSDHCEARPMLTALPGAETLIAGRGCDSNWLRQALADSDIALCIPGRKNRKEPIAYDELLYRQRNRIERNIGKLKDWRRIAKRYDRCAHGFMSAISIAATVISGYEPCA
ncbi:MAG: IS5 family transposase [Pseudomonadota bacterium]